MQVPKSFRDAMTRYQFIAKGKTYAQMEESAFLMRFINALSPALLPPPPASPKDEG